MTRGAAAHRFLSEHGLRSVVQALRDGQQLSSLHQHLELRNEQPVYVSIIDDAHQPVAKMVRERRVYVEKRQADNVRARRLPSIDTHTETPRPRLARAHTTTLVTVARLFCDMQPAEFFSAPCGINLALDQPQTSTVLT